MAWIILVIAGLFEVGWGYRPEIHRRLYPAMADPLDGSGDGDQPAAAGHRDVIAAVRDRYSVWVGVGAVGTVILGIVLLGEAANAARLISVGLIIAGITGLKLSTPV